MKRKLAFTMILSMAPFYVMALDQDSMEYQLLKSWGLKFNTEGVLRFREQPKNDAYRPWQPDISRYQIGPSVDANKPLINPLVISSKPESTRQSQP